MSKDIIYNQKKHMQQQDDEKFYWYLCKERLLEKWKKEKHYTKQK